MIWKKLLAVQAVSRFNPKKMVLQMSISDRIYLVLARDTNKGGFVEVSKPELADLHRAAVDKELELRRMEKQLEKVATYQGLELRRVETQFENWKDVLDYQTDGLNDLIGRFAHIVMPQGNQPPEKDWYCKEMARLKSTYDISPEFLVEPQLEDTSDPLTEDMEIAQPGKEQIARVPQEPPFVQVLEHAKADIAPTSPIPLQEMKSAQVSNPAAIAPIGDENHMMRSILSACALFATFIVITLYKLNQQYHIFPPIRRVL
jgi:hypothetical protein